jgi:hypothetical protein
MKIPHDLQMAASRERISVAAGRLASWASGSAIGRKPTSGLIALADGFSRLNDAASGGSGDTKSVDTWCATTTLMKFPDP